MDCCNIKVAIKARPLNLKEQLDNKVFWKVESDSVVHFDPITEKKNGEQFFFDRVFSGESTNYDVFDEIVKPIIDRGVQGFNGTVFAYGQTASGKTYTMSGDDSNPGIIPLAINYMFNAMNSSTSREFLLRACYLEIYNETVIDLLEKRNNKSQTKKIEIQKDGLHITPLKAVVCQNAQMVIDLMKLGEKNRSIGETNMNERSSRSHTIFRIILESRNVEDDCDGAYQQSVINLVDLAGSERSSQTQSSMERFKEGCKINSSLTTLGLVIQQLSECPDSSQHINFRDSKLTRILQTSLGGNSLTAIICTVTLAVEDQTQYTLSFASRAKKIKNTAKVNENVTDETLLKRYRIQLSKLNKELEGIKQNQCENDEVNEIKYKYQEEKRTNEELKERIMRLQKNMITSSVGHKDQTSNKKGYQRRRTWGGKLDNTFSSNSILETIEEDVNMPRPSVPSNFGNTNKEFKTPLESFEWDLIREEDHIVNNESLNHENAENDFSPPSSIPFTVCETPKKVLRERVNNYKNMFEMSMKENNELREFTTLEKQMFYENNEQLKDLSCLKKQVDELQNEKSESARLIEKLKRSVQLIENEKRDVEVSMEIQKNKYEKRETELLMTIQETREELQFKTDQLKKAISNDIFMTEKQEEIKRLEIKIKKMSQLNSTYINEVEMLKSQLLLKDQQLNDQSSKHYSLLNELALLQNHVTEIKSIPRTIQYLAQNNYFTLEKNEIKELDKLLEHIYNTVEQLYKENQSLKDENNNLKLITNNYTDQMNNIEKENDELRSQLNLIESNIKSIVKDFTASSEIDVDNSSTDNLIDFAVRHFDKTANEVDKLLNENTNLNEQLTLTNHNLCEVKSFIFDQLDSILQSISSLEIESNVCEDVEKFKKQLTETINENVFLKSNIQAFNKITFECVQIVEQIKTNQSNIIHLQEELTVSNAIKDEFQVQINELNELNNNLKTLIENQAKVEEEIREELIIKSTELKITLTKLDEMQLVIKENEVKFNSNIIVIDQLTSEIETVKLDLEAKSNLVVELEKTKFDLLTKCEEMDKYHQSNVENIEQKGEIENQLQKQLEANRCEIDKLNSQLESVKSELDEKINGLEKLNELNNINNSELIKQLEETNISKNEIYEELLIKTKELESTLSQVNMLQITLREMQLKTDSNDNTVEKLNIELNTIKSELEEKSNIIKDFEKDQLKLTNCDMEEINELNNVISKLKFELEEKIDKEDVLKSELHNVSEELDDATTKIIEVKQVIDTLNDTNKINIHTIEQLTNELLHNKSMLDEKINLIVELENSNSELLTKCKNSEIVDELNKIIVDLEIEIDDKTLIENETRNELLVKTTELETALNDKNEIQTLVESMEEKLKLNITEIEQLKSELVTKSDVVAELEIKIDDKTLIENETRNELLVKTAELETALNDKNEIQILVESMEEKLKLNITEIEQLKSELVSKSDLVAELENKNSQLLLKYNEMDLANKKKDEMCYENKQDELRKVLQEKASIQADLNVINQKYLEVSKHHQETKMYLEDALQLQNSNYQKLSAEFINMSNDIESLLMLQMHTESTLRKDILQKSAELEVLQKQLLESSLHQEYEKLEEEYILRSRECDEAQQKIVDLESMLSSKEESEKVLKNNYKSKCIALDEYKKNVEFLFSRNDSFQVRVNDFEDNVLVDLNEEFDLMKSELIQKSENINTLMLEKNELECNFNEIQEKLNSVTKELELSEERSEDLASIINVLVIEIKDANSIKENLEFRLNEAEHELLKSGDIVENLEYEICHAQKELENACFKTNTLEKDLYNLESKFSDIINKKDLEGCNVRNQLIDPLVDYVHDIKLKLTELNSAMISGNQSEKLLRTKIMSAEEDILPLDDTWKINYGSQPNSPDVGIGFEIDNLRKILEDKIELINTLQKDKLNTEKNINELHDQMKKLSDENNKLIDDITSMENNLKDKTSLVVNLTNELNKIKIDYSELEEHNQANKEQIHFSFDIDTELRNGKRNLVNEINLLEPGKITGVLTHHNLSTLLDTFVNLIMIKEQQIVTDLVNDHNKIKQQYEDQIKQFQEDIKKAKEWQEQVECDNEKLCTELENLKSEKHNFPSKLNEIKELKEKVLEAENQSFNYLSELQELKTHYSKMSEQNYQALSNELDTLKISSEQTIQNLKSKNEDITKKYDETISLYKDQKNCLSTLEGQIEKAQSECTCLKTIIEEKDEAIKNLLDQVQLKTKEYETLIEKNSLQRENTNETHEKIIDELQLELNNKTQEIYHKEKLLKEVTKNYNQLIEEASKVNHNIQVNDADVHAKVAELERDLQTATELNKTKIESLETELKLKCSQLEETEIKCSQLVNEIEIHKLKISTFDKQLEDCYQTLKLKDNEIENYQRQLKINEDDLININEVTDKLRKMLNCNGTLSILYENIGSLVENCESLKEENEELKLTNSNLDSECESMLNELKFKEDKIVEFITLEDELRHNNELLTEERDFLKNKCEQFKNANDNVKKLNEEICSYEQNIYELRKEKGHLIVQHDKELKQLKTELKEVHTKNLELLNDYNKLSETAKNLEKSLKEDIQQLNRCIVDKNAKISTLELFSKTNTDELKKKNHELEHVFKRARDENHMLRKELRRFKEMMNTRKADQCTQTVEEQSVVSGAMVAAHKSMTEKITKLENDNQVMKKMLHHRKAKIEELQKQLEEKHR